MTIRLIDIKSGNWLAFSSNKNTTDWIVFNNYGFWDASQYGGDLIAVVKDMNSWNVDQFAV